MICNIFSSSKRRPTKFRPYGLPFAYFPRGTVPTGDSVQLEHDPTDSHYSTTLTRPRSIDAQVGPSGDYKSIKTVLVKDVVDSLLNPKFVRTCKGVFVLAF